MYKHMPCYGIDVKLLVWYMLVYTSFWNISKLHHNHIIKYDTGVAILIM